MRVAPWVLVPLLCLSLASCKSLGKKDASAGSADGKGTGAGLTGNRGAAPAPPPPPPLNNVAATGGAGGVLAGQVLDSTRRRLPGAYIQVSEAGDMTRRAAPIEIAADNQGYFIISGGVEIGHRYQLTARARDGSRQLTGAIWATPPDARLVICMNDDMGLSGPGGPPNSAPAQPRRAAELGPPQGATAPWPAPSAPESPAPPPPDPPPSTQGGILEPRTRIRPENTTMQEADNTSPPASIPGQTMPRTGTPSSGWTAPGAAVAPVAPIAPAPQFGPARVPSCQLTGQTLYNFALYDLSGQPWEYRQRRGRLMLVDFWGTWCVHCLHAVPNLNILQERYGPFGLEVVGIAYETGTPAEQARKVNNVRNRLHMNYRVLMGSDRETCPVRTQFGVKNWPTLVLLDDNGRIIWRGEGFEPQHFRELEVVIRQRLGAR